MIPKTANRKPKTGPSPTSITLAQRRKIQAMRKQIFGDDDEGYREMLWGVARVKSSSELTRLTAGLVITHLNKFLGVAEPPKPSPQVRLIRRLWAQVSRAPVKEREKALRAFLRRMRLPESLEWLSPAQAQTVIEALKAMVARQVAKGAKGAKG